MEFFLLLLVGILVLGILVLWVVAQERKRREEGHEERRQIAELSHLVISLEKRLSILEAGGQAAQPEARFADPSMSAQSAAQPSGFEAQPAEVSGLNRAAPDQPPTEIRLMAEVAPVFVAPPTPPNEQVTPPRSPSLEERLGANWLNKLGIVILVIGVSLFLAYQLRTLGPLGKTIVGFALSATLLVGGLFLERRDNYRIFARAAIGGGWALTFFVTYAMYHVAAARVLSSQAVDLVLMMLVAAGMVWHSLRYRSQVITGLAFLLAFTTVGISDVNVFSLVAGVMLAIGLVWVVTQEYWFELGLLGLVGVYVNHFFWLHRVLPGGGQPGHDFPEFFASAGLLFLYWLVFRVAYVLRAPRNRREELFASGTAVLNSAGLLGLLKYQSAHPEWAFRALIVLGVAELLLALFARRKRRPAFIVLSSIASVLLLAAIPFRFSGTHWSLLWLFEAEALFLAGLRMREPVFRRLGLLAGSVAAMQILIADACPIFDLRQSGPDPTHHSTIVIALLSGAILFWLNSEIAPLRWKELLATETDAWALRATSYLGVITAAIGLWVLFPDSATIVAWMIVALLLSLAADKVGSIDLATQVDLLAVATIFRIGFINLELTSHWGFVSQRAATVGFASVLLYAITRRRTEGRFLASRYIPVAYSWTASALIAVLLWYGLRPITVALGWGVMGLLLFEIGIVWRHSYLRRQGYALLAASFVRIFFVNFNVGGSSLVSARIFTVLPLIAAYLWVHERLHREQECDRIDGIMHASAAWAATIAIAALAYFELSSEWVVAAWAALVLVLITAGWWLKRPTFMAQALTLLLVTGVRAVLFNLFSAPPLDSAFWNARLYSIVTACALLFLSLPVAFRLRRAAIDSTAQNGAPGWINYLLARPEQPLFFVPLIVFTIFLAVQMRAGMITVAWSALGVIVFLFALWVRERSYRLAGLGLLMLGVGKIIFVDIWKAGATDRYITLIVMGIALLLVSFLYSRYRETILKFL